MFVFVNMICDCKQNDTHCYTGGIDSYICKAAVSVGDKTLDGLVRAGYEKTGQQWKQQLFILLVLQHGV